MITIKKTPGEGLYQLHILPENDKKRVHSDVQNLENDIIAFGFQMVAKKIQIWHDAMSHSGKKTFMNLIAMGKIPKFWLTDIK